MPARPSIHAGEHAPHEDGPGLSRVQSDRGAHGPAAGAPAADALQARASDGGRERPDARGKATLSSLRQRAEICTCVVRYVGVENKCLSKAFWRRADEQRLHIDLQVTAYFCAAREAGVPLDRMLYRTTFKPGIDRRMSRNPETIDQYLERLAADIRERPDYYEAEYELYRSEQDMDEFLAEVDEIDSEIKRSRKRGAWARSTERCADYGGCPFLSLCRGVPDAIEAYNVKPAPIPQRAQRVLDTLAESVSEAFNPTEGTRIPELVGQTGLAPAAVTYELRRLIDLELVERVSRGCYATTQSGRDRADGAL